jgi:concanavalin A-like lectin/glucanase superfamily protein
MQGGNAGRDGKVFRYTGPDSYTHSGGLGVGWRHLVAMRKGRRLKLCVDGRLVATSTEFNLADFDIANRERLKIGFGAHDYFNGSLSNLRIYRRAWTDAGV